MKITLKGHRVTQNGRIYPFGIIYLLREDIVEELLVYVKGAAMQGLPCWSERLSRYAPRGNSRFWARVRGDTLQIINFNGETIDKIAGSKFFSFDRQRTADVIKNGFLVEGAHKKKFLVEALLSVGRAQRPAYYDNSPFVRVDATKFAGQQLVEIMFFDLAKKGYWAKVFTSDGKPVPCRVEYPLALRIRARRTHANSEAIIYDSRD